MSLRRLALNFAASLGLMVAASGAQAQVFGTGPWTGLYVGLHGGPGWAKDNVLDTNGWAGGIQAGYNLQLGAIVAGIEADYTWGSLARHGTFGVLPVSSSVDSLWSVRGRLGFSIANSVMLYGTAGYGGFDVGLRTVVSNVTLIGKSDYKAFVVGGGLEVLLTRNIMLRGEALHYLGDGSSILSARDGDVTMVRAGVSYKF